MDAGRILDLVKRHGSTLTLVKKTAGTYNTTTGSITNTETEYSFSGYIFDASTGFDGLDTTSRGSKRVVIPALDLAVVPAEDDEVKGLGDTLRILSVATHYRVGKALVYIAEVRE